MLFLQWVGVSGIILVLVRDLVEAFDRLVLAIGWLRVITGPRAKPRAHASRARGIEFGSYIGNEKHLGERQVERPGNATITLGRRLRTSTGVEIVGDESR